MQCGRCRGAVCSMLAAGAVVCSNSSPHRVSRTPICTESTFFQTGSPRLDTALQRLTAEFFDVITLFTVFSSIFSANMRANVVREVSRVVRPGGVVLIYDFRLPSLVNRNTRPVSRREVRRWFKVSPAYAESLTLIPPLARRLGRLTDPWYGRLAALPPLRTHNLILIRLC